MSRRLEDAIEAAQEELEKDEQMLERKMKKRKAFYNDESENPPPTPLSEAQIQENLYRRSETLKKACKR